MQIVSAESAKNNPTNPLENLGSLTLFQMVVPVLIPVMPTGIPKEDLDKYQKITGSLAEQYDSIAESYVTTVQQHAPRERENIDEIIRLSSNNTRPTQETKTVLDIGCAGARDAGYWIQNGFDYYGMELSREMIRHAKESLASAGVANVNGHLYQGDMAMMKPRKESFDVIMISSVIQHTPPEISPLVLKNAFDGLKNGGIVYLNFRFLTTICGLVSARVTSQAGEIT